jgi:glycolate oxidase iron-sulfur subunit
MTWVTEWAPERAELDQCIDCGLCLPACPTFRLTGDEAASPRGRLTAMRAVAAGVADVDGRFAEMMDMCLQCRACEVVCPSMVPFGRVMEGARAETAAQLPTTASILNRYLFGRVIAVRWIVRLASVLLAVMQRVGVSRHLPGPGRRASGLRRVPLPVPATVGRRWMPQGEPVGTVALLSGCVMDPWFSGVHAALIQVLRTAGYRVDAPAGQTCCGALATHEGAAYDAARMARRNARAFAGYDMIVVDAAGCGAHLKNDGSVFADRVVDASELVATLLDEGKLPEADRVSAEVAVQDPCHLRHAQRLFDEPRRVLRAAGYQPVEIDADGMCCGAAGAYMLDHPEVSDELGRAKAAQVRESGVTVVASANPGCEMQLRSHLGGGFRVVHPVELYADWLSSAL